MGIQVNPYNGVGAEVLGVNLQTITDDEFAAVEELFSEHGLLFFRDQTLDPEEHIQFAERWGQVNVNRFFKAHPDYPQIAMVAKEKEDVANIGGGWHTDHTYDHEPALGSILVAVELPAQGGDTWFTSMYKAYDSLSSGIKETLGGLRAVHSAKHVFGTQTDYQAATKGRIGNASAADVLEDPVHPVIITHPLSGKKALFVNPAFTLRFDGWTAEESAPLLEYLYGVASQEAFVTRFNWQPGSVAFWDNRATWHFAQNDYHGARRIMHRITIEGCALG